MEAFQKDSTQGEKGRERRGVAERETGMEKRREGRERGSKREEDRKRGREFSETYLLGAMIHVEFEPFKSDNWRMVSVKPKFNLIWTDANFMSLNSWLAFS